jgi:uncharacterized membrane protein
MGRDLGMRRCGWEDKIKMDLKIIICVNVNLINAAQDGMKWVPPTHLRKLFYLLRNVSYSSSVLHGASYEFQTACKHVLLYVLEGILFYL